ncbi:MAG TPA: trypsin-like peptidase domain-containing protein [Chthonomonadaceae bacterium]|nr:trypsin-like peptidase domain-containing protein [Chthonomonadaceae bacterium]
MSYALRGQARNQTAPALSERAGTPGKRQSVSKFAWVSVVGLAALLAPLTPLPVRAEERTAAPKASAARLADLQEAFAAIADEIEPAVVTIYTTKSLRSAAEGEANQDAPPGIIPFGRNGSRRATGTGSGVIISKEGWVLTNDHVVGGADKVTVRLHDGREFTGQVKRDFRSDLAVVKIAATSPLPVARLGDSDKVKVGHWAIAIGSPYRYEGSLSVGVISSLYRTQRIGDFGSFGRVRFYPNLLQTDAAINPGNSGGPLCNLDGEVIGINTAIESEGGGSVGIGFAIPINTAKFVISQLLAKGRVSYGYLGISPTSVTPRLASALNVERGALIDMEPMPETPAAKAGLHAGDVIIAIDKKPVRNEIDLRTLIAQTAPNTTIELTVVRNAKERTLKATLMELPDTEAVPKERPRVAGKARLGIEVQPLTDKLAEQAGVPAKTPGVVIKSIDPTASAADVEGLAEGMILLKVNDVPTPTVPAFQAAIASLKSGDQVKLLCQVEKTIRFLVVPVD